MPIGIIIFVVAAEVKGRQRITRKKWETILLNIWVYVMNGKKNTEHYAATEQYAESNDAAKSEHEVEPNKEEWQSPKENKCSEERKKKQKERDWS